MKILRVCAFTQKGRKTAEEILNLCPQFVPQYREKADSLSDWTEDGFKKHLPILFVGACGIAVRTIAPFVKDKLTDSAVLVMDEAGKFIIPLLSGHVGGANELAGEIAKASGAVPVLTTATDVEGVWAVDVFAQKNGFRILNRQQIAKVSGKLLLGETVGIFISPEIILSGECKKKMPENLRNIKKTEDADVILCTKKTLPKEQKEALVLCAKEYVLGVGCRKDKDPEEMMEFVREKISGEISDEIFTVASIDRKERELALILLAQYYHVPYQTFSAEELMAVKGDFSASGFVAETVGVDNVCERAAMCAAGEGARLIMTKTAENGKTMAAAKRIVRIAEW